MVEREDVSAQENSCMLVLWWAAIMDCSLVRQVSQLTLGLSPLQGVSFPCRVLQTMYSSLRSSRHLSTALHCDLRYQQAIFSQTLSVGILGSFGILFWIKSTYDDSEPAFSHICLVQTFSMSLLIFNYILSYFSKTSSLWYCHDWYFSDVYRYVLINSTEIKFKA